ncbi:DUF58 domain-containing protein [Rhodanobacter sp. FDAARGOS 1247]|uniref:DUF58 domain-containing protein n=1 Tax=Rhodanobacter sp. FDAARGOS 1247 TaxID=2778082 RepID=UPI001951E500|nr:DUF58 domain-containing protein [Rhodanobacter sp. FDAARGOS 1247]QRP65699.1 DUF58 domain-containing protein [Rhodanobacter sp. FDAARGOS 1247]
MRPAPLLLWLLLGWIVLGVLASLGWLPLSAWLAAAVVIALFALVDVLRLRRMPSPELQRDVVPVMPLGPPATISLRLRGGTRRTQALRLHDLHPGGWVVHGMPRDVRLPPGRDLLLDYSVIPDARGQFVFDGCHVQLCSPWRAWTARRVIGASSTVRVYPNFASLAELAGLSVELASRSVGARLQRRRGEGTEFQELRDYRVGDSLRKIDWKATARSSRLISREYRDERNQQVVLMLDCGRRMLAQDDQLVHFDHVLNASLALASIALRQGDAVGMLACTGQQQRWLPPQQGSLGMDMLLGAGYDLQALPEATDYLAAASALQAHQRRRALVVLITNVRDEDDVELRAAVGMLSKRHLVMLVSLRELALDRAASEPGEELEDSIRSAAAMHYLAERDRVHESLRREGVNTLDVSCGELSGALIERYLALKRSSRL